MQERSELARGAAALLTADPPSQLVCAIELIADQIHTAETQAAASPRRAEVRSKLAELRCAALKIAKLLEDETLHWLRPSLQGGGGRNKVRITPDRMRWLAKDAEWGLEYVRSGRGSDKLDDVLGVPRGRFLCAAAAVRLFELANGSAPSKENLKAREFCDLLWRAAGGGVSEAVERGDTDNLAAWERHLTSARKASKGGLSERALGAWLIIGETIKDSHLRDIFPPKSAE